MNSTQLLQAIIQKDQFISLSEDPEEKKKAKKDKLKLLLNLLILEMNDEDI